MKALRNDRTRVLLAIWKPKIDKIQEVMSDYYKVTIEVMHLHTRVGTSTRARQMVHYFSREMMPLCPLAIIGLVTGNGVAFDHSAIWHSHRKITNLVTLKTRAGEIVYPNIVAEVAELRRLIAIKFNRGKIAREYRHRCHVRAIFFKARKFKPILNETR